MAIIAKAGGNGGNFEPAPTGVHQAVCVDVVDMGILEVTYAGKTKEQHKVRLVWQIEEPMPDGRPFICQKRYTLSLWDKATLRKDLESWRGRAFTEEELRGFDLEVLIGVNCLVNVMQVQKAGQTYANVNAIMPLKKGTDKMVPTGYKRVKDRTDADQPDHDESSPLTDDDIPF